MPRIDTSLIAETFYYQYVLVYGRPDKLIFDSQMDSAQVNQILQALKITSGVSWPHSHNGVLVERVFRFCLGCMRAIFSELNLQSAKVEFHRWARILLHVTAAYNAAPIPGTSICPFQVIFGRNCLLPTLDPPTLRPHPGSSGPSSPTDLHSQKVEVLHAIRKALRHLHEETVTRRALQVNSGRSYPTLAPGDFVTICDGTTSDNRQDKLLPVARTGFRVINTVGHSAVRVRNMATGRETVRLLSQVRRRPAPDDSPSPTFPGKQPVQGMISIVKFPSSSTVCFVQVTRIDFSPDVIQCQVFSESRPRTSDASHFSSLIGRRVAKSFGSHGLHFGTVQSINAQGTWFYVTYDDGDGEDLNFKEVSRLLLPEPRLSPTPLRMIRLSPEFVTFSQSGRIGSYAALAKLHPDDFPAVCTFLRRDADFISDAFELNPNGTIPDHIVTALEDSIAVWPASRGPIPNITPAPAPPPTMPSADTLSSLSVRRHPPLLFPPRKVPRITSSPNRPSEIAREPVHDDGLDTSKG